MTNKHHGATATPGRAYGGKSLAERQQMRRDRFIEAGTVLFGRDGFRAATVKGLCREAGLTERYFYESFGNSEALFAAVYRTLIAELKADIITALQAAPPEPEPAARAGLRMFFETMYRRPEIARILLIEIFGISGEIDKLYRSTTRDFTSVLQELFGAIFSLEQGGSQDARVISTGLVGSTIHIAMYWALSDYQESVDVVVESSLALYVAVARLLPEDR